ncbi:MAG: Hsp33 family molecular chaperone HslO, partial [Xanthomonadaceae bacterium]|nr:Hsp33 family molecular chaperone HslO [Xanthomonadaceae bacterium]
CSRERVAAMLRSLGREEVETTLAEQGGRIEVHCEFCSQRYEFDRIDAEQLLRGAGGVSGTA